MSPAEPLRWQDCKPNMPKWEDIPAVPGMEHGCLWGFWDKDGVDDNIGTLNLLTPEVVAAAAQEIKYGDRVMIDWPLNHPDEPTSGRLKFGHKVLHFDTDPFKPGLVGNDDEIHINTQSTSQWDGYKHLGLQDGSRKFYHGLTQDEIVAGTDEGRCGIHHWCDAGGIVGRGILLDWKTWYEEKHQKPIPLPYTTHRIPVEDLEEVAKAQGTEFRQGDILIVRTGFTDWFDNEPDREMRYKYMTMNRDFIGLDANEKTKLWLWEKHFSAVAADTLSFEAWPNPPDMILHEWLLVHWGTPIGEFWELDKLAALCKKRQKWSFFFTSAPLRVPGGIASPPNGICIL